MENGKDGLKLVIKDMKVPILMEISLEFIRNGISQERLSKILFIVQEKGFKSMKWLEMVTDIWKLIKKMVS